MSCIYNKHDWDDQGHCRRCEDLQCVHVDPEKGRCRHPRGYGSARGYHIDPDLCPAHGYLKATGRSWTQPGRGSA